MPIVADTIADTYDLLIGVDTHAASHTFALIHAATGAVADTQGFPTSPAGLDAPWPGSSAAPTTRPSWSWPTEPAPTVRS